MLALGKAWGLLARLVSEFVSPESKPARVHMFNTCTSGQPAVQVGLQDSSNTSQHKDSVLICLRTSHGSSALDTLRVCLAADAPVEGQGEQGPQIGAGSKTLHQCIYIYNMNMDLWKTLFFHNLLRFHVDLPGRKANHWGLLTTRVPQSSKP